MTAEREGRHVDCVNVIFAALKAAAPLPKAAQAEQGARDLIAGLPNNFTAQDTAEVFSGIRSRIEEHNERNPTQVLYGTEILGHAMVGLLKRASDAEAKDDLAFELAKALVPEMSTRTKALNYSKTGIKVAAGLKNLAGLVGRVLPVAAVASGVMALSTPVWGLMLGITIASSTIAATEFVLSVVVQMPSTEQQKLANRLIGGVVSAAPAEEQEAFAKIMFEATTRAVGNIDRADLMHSAAQAAATPQIEQAIERSLAINPVLMRNATLLAKKSGLLPVARMAGSAASTVASAAVAAGSYAARMFRGGRTSHSRQTRSE